MKFFNFLLMSWVLPSAAEVEFLLAVWRHGDRSPENHPYPNDPYNETAWPRGWNQLTNVGIEQATKLGRFLKRRYQNSVLPKFDRKKILIRASDADRAIETAQAVTLTLFPPYGDQLWTEGKYRYWQPIPIRTNGKPDPTLRPSKIKCPEYQKLVSNEKIAIEAEINEKYKTEFDIITTRTGYTTRYSKIKDVYNIMLEHYNGYPLPDWINEKVNGKPLLDTIIEIRRIARLQLFNTREKSKYMAGFLINSWARSLEEVSQKNSTKKALLYSSHDGTVSSLLYVLNVSNHQLIPYTACVMVELHTGNILKIFMRNTTSENPDDVHQLIIPGCNSECPLSQFLDSVSDVRVKSIDDLEKICNSALRTFSVISILVIVFMLL